MVSNRFDLESASLHRRRFLSRWWDRLRGLPVRLEDISVIRVSSNGSASYEARRAGTDIWSVYRTYSDSYDGGKGLSVTETLQLDLSLPDALDALVRYCPQSSGAGEYDHPLQVAKMIGHRFA